MELYRVPVYEGLTSAVMLMWAVDHSAAPHNSIRWTIAELGRMAPGDDVSRGILATYAEIAARTRIPVSTVKRAVKWMRDSGEWIVIPGTGGRAVSADKWDGMDDGRCNAYYPVIPPETLPDGVRLIGTRVIATGTAHRDTITRNVSA